LASSPLSGSVETHGTHAHHRALAHQFDSLDQQKETSTLGMWLFLVATMVLGATFLGIKWVEYREKFETHHVPGPSFHFVPESEHVKVTDPQLEQHASIFFSLYFIMTGLHALHMIIGIGILGVLTELSRKGKYDSEYHNPLEMTGLYWHFVDIVWIFLFPLLYLLGAHAR